MTAQSSSIQPFEIIPVSTMELSCDGEGGTLGHPRVFLHVDVYSHKIQCPYCSRLYVYEGGQEQKHA